MFVGKKVGEFSYSQRHKLSPTLEVEEILEGDILQEYKLGAMDEINSNFKKFSEKYGIKTEVQVKQQLTAVKETDQLLKNFQDQL